MSTSLEEMISQAQQLWLSGDRAGGGICFAKAFELAPDDPAPDIALARVASISGDFDIARDAYANAVGKAPRNANYLANYALMLNAFGRFDDAREVLERAIDAKPESGLAYFVLSQIHVAQADDPLVETLEKIANDARNSQEDVGYAEFALAKFYDDLGEWDRAFDYASKANARIPSNYNHHEFEDYCARLRNAFSPDFLDRRANLGADDATPIFIVGMPRSGTSLIENRLSRFDGVKSLGELTEMGLVVDQVELINPRALFPEAVAGLTPERFSELGKLYTGAVAERLRGEQGVRYFTDKNPLNFTLLGLIRLVLPNATVLHTTRDPRDICLSIYFQAFDPGNYSFSYDLEQTGRFYAAYDRLMKFWTETLGDFITPVAYEAVVGAPDDEIAKIAARLGLDSSTDETANEIRPIKTASAWQARQPVYSRSHARWRNYEHRLEPLIDILVQEGVALP